MTYGKVSEIVQVSRCIWEYLEQDWFFFWEKIFKLQKMKDGIKKRFTQPSPKNHTRFLFMRKRLITTLVSAGPSPCSTWSRSCGCPDRVSSAYRRLMWRAGRCLIGPGQPEDSNTQEDAQQTREESWWINKFPSFLASQTHNSWVVSPGSALSGAWYEPPFIYSFVDFPLFPVLISYSLWVCFGIIS